MTEIPTYDPDDGLAPIVVAAAFRAAIGEGRAEEAWGYLTKEFRQQLETAGNDLLADLGFFAEPGWRVSGRLRHHPAGEVCVLFLYNIEGDVVGDTGPELRTAYPVHLRRQGDDWRIWSLGTPSPAEAAPG